MKKLFTIFIAIALSLSLLVGCGAPVQKEVKSPASMFVEVEATTIWKVVYHRETKVMYTVSYGGYNSGTFTLMVNSDGTPQLWEGNAHE